MKTNYITYLKLVAFAVLLTLAFNSCKKYPEDKFYSLQTVKMRLEGGWKLNNIEIDGVNRNADYTDSLQAPVDFFQFWFSYNRDFENEGKKDLLTIKNTSNLNDIGTNTQISISHHKPSKIGIGNKVIGGTKSPISDEVYNLVSFVWDIKKLHKREMILSCTKGNNSYRIYLNKIKQ